MQMLIDCSNCRRTLNLPPGATTIRCAICHAITHVAESRSIPAPHFYYNNINHSTPQHLPPSSHCAPYSGSVPWAPAPPNPQGRKKAVICGISYKGSQFELKGCLNDAKCMKYLLMNRFGFPEQSILMLTEEEADPSRRPTKKNIRMALHWLVLDCQAGDSLVFHYSGHGSQQQDENGDEVDGFDETILPMDFEQEGMIVDDEINDTIVRPLPRGAKLHAIVDACHSGTVLDLPYLCRMTASGQYKWEDHRPKNGQNKGTSGGEVFCFSGCDDNQTSADTVALSKVTSTGAMTFSFIQAVEEGQASTYGILLNSMKATIRHTNLLDGAGRVTSILALLLNGRTVLQGLKQEPQLTASEPFDVYTKPFSL
ncbi:Metacaspase-1 [Rhynchospora pubera]|uniref:Metacaspase-1 n=1 Tax=Rhynchospora pubera TaxID=906938 RepID=A0AAV8EZY7_9POAL|nr:Metacaspase-1 [Rhynchospora pubera]